VASDIWLFGFGAVNTSVDVVLIAIGVRLAVGLSPRALQAGIWLQVFGLQYLVA
jgi:hypothetical protein